MKKLLLLLFFIPNLVMSGGMGGSKESVPGVNPFEILKGAIEAKPRNKSKETAQTKETNKLIFPSDIDGAEEIYKGPKLEKIDEYGDKKLYNLEGGEYVSTSSIHSYLINNYPNSKVYDIEKSCSPTETVTNGCAVKTWAGWTDKCYTYKTGGGYDPDAKKVLDQSRQSTDGYRVNRHYRFITKLDEKIIFAKDVTQIDRKLTPKISGVGDLVLNLDANNSAKKYFETTLHVTFSIHADNNFCVTRAVDGYWYDPNELKLVKEEPEARIQNTEETIIVPVDDIAITFDGINDSYYDGYNLHERLIESSLINSEIKIYCSSCTEQKDYSIKVDVGAYKKNFAAELKAQEKIDFDQSVAPFKSQCEAIGFKPGTDKFKNCLVEMMN
jgi:hypothetical protein